MPAAEARIGVVDQLFSRVGAADDLARGRSTFMVEMVETAAILNQAGPTRAGDPRRDRPRHRDLRRAVDRLGGARSTCTTSTAAAALFATHYHELTALAEKLPGLRNATVAVREWEGEVIFLHEVREGAADRSYGVQVARLAGLPPAVVERARVVLEALERGERERGGKAKALVDDLPLFSRAAAAPPYAAGRALRRPKRRLRAAHPDELSPREALALVYELRSLAMD